MSLDTALGVPEIIPALESVIPVGSEPLTKLYVRVSFSLSVAARLMDAFVLDPSNIVPTKPSLVQTGDKLFVEDIENDLGILFKPSDAVTVKLYVVSDTMLGNVPDISPVDEFNVTPDGKDPEVTEYVIVESESVAVAEIDIEICSSNVPREPEAVCHTGLALTNKASGKIPNKLDGFVTLMSYGSLVFDSPVNVAVICTSELNVVDDASI